MRKRILPTLQRARRAILLTLALAFLPQAQGQTHLTLDIGWDPIPDFTNTGNAGPLLLQQVSKSLGTGAAVPVQVRNLVAAASVCTSLT